MNNPPYTKPHRNEILFLFFIALIILLPACQAATSHEPEVTVSIQVDGDLHPVTMAPGSTVQQALDTQHFTLSNTDRVIPSTFTTLTNGMIIVITRIREEFETQQITLPYSRQELKNESLTSGESRLIQAGQNGLEEVTIRHIFENNVESGSSIVSENILQDPVPEIIMIGVQSPFSPIEIPGKLAYLTGGNAWVMDGNTSNRWPIVTSGDLDGHIFNLSPDGNWLLFTKKSSKPNTEEINTLWVVSTARISSSPIDLKVSNVVHFADWQPSQNYLIAFSTVEPSSTAPGWDANNDLHFLRFSGEKPGEDDQVLDTNYGGIYPWWGITFAWSPDGSILAFSRPDAVGIVDVNNSSLRTLSDITALNTHGDWAWTPNIAVTNDNQGLIFTTHSEPSGLVSPEDSPNFDLVSVSLADSITHSLVSETGMFAYPTPAPLAASINGKTPLLAFIQAIFPSQSAISRYKLVVTNMDGTNLRVLFPTEGQSGLEPQQPVWSPRPVEENKNYISIFYEGNLWIVDADTGISQQVTGDGLTQRIDWK